MYQGNRNNNNPFARTMKVCAVFEKPALNEFGTCLCCGLYTDTDTWCDKKHLQIRERKFELKLIIKVALELEFKFLPKTGLITCTIYNRDDCEGSLLKAKHKSINYAWKHPHLKTNLYISFLFWNSWFQIYAFVESGQQEQKTLCFVCTSSSFTCRFFSRWKKCKSV